MERPRFPKDLEEAGYSTRYYYAGDIDFGSFPFFSHHELSGDGDRR